ncbi:peptide-methionine (R)-S-oxide reductase MsrB [Corynebacterium pseudogenitalium]|uniref:peptide-methionine (R)-S-oxide reductase n=1 Tax=Corynebacterium pseudogenitalium TaxID=38303 RepID=A0ABD4TRB0_9CORY|nr:peptide-methionine (R)-S-oxide reductase MsrB [Corynebacterium pseudogenitalium]MCQ4613311.1 peptide-methionine (R)-S-oxide reductase MsrB [Corynebacterium pseudogenitalium]
MTENRFQQMTEAEWKAHLAPEEFRVLRQAGTEAPGVGEYTDHFEEGIYVCRACGAELFRSTTKFDAPCGWPAFYAPDSEAAVIKRADYSLGMVRTEVLCAQCHSHLGHVFEGEGFNTPTDQRYCINSISLKFDAPRKDD